MAVETRSLAQRFSRGFAWNYASRVVEFGLRFLFVSYAAARLGPAGFGIYSFATSTAVLATLLAALGDEQALNNFTPTLRDNPRALRWLLRRLLQRRAVLTAAVALALFAVSPLLVRFSSGAARAVPAVLPYFIAFNLFNLLSYFLVGLLDLRPVALTRVLVQLFNLTAAWWLFRRGAGPETLLLLIGVTGALALAVLLVYLRSYLTGPGEDPAPTVNLARINRFSLTLGATNTVSYLLGQQSDVLLLGFLLGDETQIGLYNLAATLNLVIGTGVLIGFEGVTQSALAERARQGPAAVATVWEALMKVTALLTVPVLGLAIIVARPVLALYGPAYLPAVPLLQLYLGFSLLGRFFGGGVNTGTLYALRHERFPFVVRLISGLLNVALGIVLILRFGAAGAILATGLSGLVTVIPETILAVRVTGARYPGRFMLKLALAAALGWGAALLVAGPGLLRLAGAGASFVVVFLAALACFKPLGPGEQALIERASPRLRPLVSRFG